MNVDEAKRSNWAEKEVVGDFQVDGTEVTKGGVANVTQNQKGISVKALVEDLKATGPADTCLAK